jgi:hypothetical protein
MPGLIPFLVHLFVVCLVVGVLLWALTVIPGLPPIVPTIAKVIAALVIVLYLASALLGEGGMFSSTCYGRRCMNAAPSDPDTQAALTPVDPAPVQDFPY